MEIERSQIERCAVAEEIVAYLYAEMSGAKRDAFENHLVDCAACIDEFAEMSHARYSVYEWQREEFAPLATPRFKIPYDSERQGFFDGLTDLLSIRWVVPTVAMAVIVVAVTVGLLGSAGTQLPNPPALAEAKVGEATVPTVSSPTVAQAGTQDLKTAIDVRLIKSAAKRTAPARPVRTVNAKSTVPLPRDTVRAVAAASVRAPVLSSEVEVADRSLRLSDIFDSEGTR